MLKSISFSSLKIEIASNDDEVVYTFSGDVDENFRHEEVPRISRKNIIFKLKGVNNFNSCGIREWIYLVRDISKLGILLFQHCSVSIIDQINMVPDSLGSGKIISFYAPYYCECSGEINKLIEVNESCELLNSKLAPRFDCEKCAKPLDFDALEESYFLFINSNVSQAS